MMTMHMKTFGTRLDEQTGSELVKAAAFTGLRPADLLRIGAGMVLESIRKNNGLQLGKPPPRRRKKTVA
jgi:hypothetical protein